MTDTERGAGVAMAGPEPDDLAELAEGAPRRSRTALWSALVVGAVLAALVVVLATREPAVNRLTDSPLLGRPAPPIDGTALDGTPFRLDRWRGRWVVVNYFATWCVPCVREHPELVRFSQRHQVTDDARVVSVVFDDTPESVRALFDRLGGTWPVVDDGDGRIALSYGVSGVPESYLVNPDGFIVAKILGGITADGLEGILATAATPATTTPGGSRR